MPKKKTKKPNLPNLIGEIRETLEIPKEENDQTNNWLALAKKHSPKIAYQKIEHYYYWHIRRAPGQAELTSLINQMVNANLIILELALSQEEQKNDQKN